MQYHNRLAFNGDGEAMFYCFNTCREFIRTIPALMYDEKNVEDIDTTMEDHIYDECRYVLMEHPIAAPVKRGRFRQATILSNRESPKERNLSI